MLFPAELVVQVSEVTGTSVHVFALPETAVQVSEPTDVAVQVSDPVVTLLQLSPSRTPFATKVADAEICADAENVAFPVTDIDPVAVISA